MGMIYHFDSSAYYPNGEFRLAICKWTSRYGGTEEEILCCRNYDDGCYECLPSSSGLNTNYFDGIIVAAND